MLGGQDAMPASAPFFSIIIVCRNPGPRLQAALDSVWAQRDTDREIIVIDGASTDGTREWLETRRAQITTLRSEPDRGVYDAMNKGLAAARGDWVLFLGADDRLANDAVLREVQARLPGFAAGVAVGAVLYDDGRIYRLGGRDTAVRRNFVHHQGAFYRRSLFDRCGPFDDSLTVMADYDFNLRLQRGGVDFAALNLCVAECASRGLSDAGAWRGYREEIAVRHRHFPAWRCWLWDGAVIIRCLRKKIVHRLHPA
jgi:putative colanic acid biosynthesis glycosyltransferase